MDGSDAEYDPEPDLLTGQVIPQTGEVLDEDTFKILIASDIHLGYCDDDPEREKDSFISFEEILIIAKERDVDFILLGGDLFHENKPKLSCLRKATELCRKHCLGDKPVVFQYISDPKRDFGNQDDPEVNYYDSNINVAYPIFSIHGNHDDPVGITKTSAVDHLAASKLLNHFGQWENLNRVTISPVLLVKGQSKLALYGLGHMKDERLHRLMLDKKVVFVGPEEEKEEWFNILVLHQNREKRGPKNYIPESFIPGYMNLVVWGHEHESKPDLEEAAGLPSTRVLQPGSPVATSLCPGESREKHCFLLCVNRRKFKLEPIKLQTVRPFVMKDIIAKEVFESSTALGRNATPKEKSRVLEKYLEMLINRLVDDSADKLTGHPKQPLKPLIRIRVFHDNMEETFNQNRFNQKFVEKVANDDIVMFKKTLVKREDGRMEIDADDIQQLVMEQEDDDLDSHVESIVESYFKLARDKGEMDNLLEILSERGLSEAVKTAVEKNDDKAIQIVIDAQMEKVIGYLTSKEVSEDTADMLLEQLRERRAASTDQEKTEVESLLSQLKPRANRANGRGGGGDDDEAEENGDDNEDNSAGEILDDDDEFVAPTRGRGGRGSRGGRGRGAAASASTRGRGRGSRGSRGKAAANSRDESSPPSSPASSVSTSSRGGRGRGGGRGTKETSNSSMRQTTLTFRRSPRKGSQAMQFDDDDSD